MSVALLFGGVFLPTAAAEIVSGRVSNEATGAYLEGARVEVQGVGTATFTDRLAEV